MLHVSLHFILLMDGHIKNAIARAKKISNRVALGRVAARLLCQILQEVNCSDVSAGQESADHRHFDA